MSRVPRAKIRLGAIQKNHSLLKQRHGGGPCMPVIKANAYGHGLLPVAKALRDADCLGVARVDEAKALCQAGIKTPIAVLGGATSPAAVKEAIELQLQLSVHTTEHIEWLENAGQTSTDVWLKINTGMNRLGIAPGDADRAIERLRKCAAVGEVRLMTHLAEADDKGSVTTTRQLEIFKAIVDRFSGEVSIANSGGILGWNEIVDEFGVGKRAGRLWSRPGISLYGVSPFPDDDGAAHDLYCAMQFESHLIATRKVAKGEPVGYGGDWQAGRDTVIGLIAAGYGDGYDRHIVAGTPILVNGRRCPVVGPVSMDITAVELGPDATNQIGDDVVLWGSELPVEEIARHADTIPLTLVTGISERVERIYED